MRILLDTHYLLWSFIEPSRIQNKHRDYILSQENEVYFSQVSLWEISIKYNLGKLLLNGGHPEKLYEAIQNSFLLCKQIENEELITFYKLSIAHRDPFDRLLIWQAINADMFLLSSDKRIGGYKKHGLKIL